MRDNDGTPLPGELSGVIIERPIRIDSSLIYLVNGALAELADIEKLEQTGTLTVDDAKSLLSQMLWEYFTRKATMVYAGMVIDYAGDFPLPDEAFEAGWLPCEGGSYAVVDYPSLYAVIGRIYTEPELPETVFRVPDYRDVSPMGAGLSIPLAGRAGEFEHTLVLTEMPAHSHYRNPTGTSELFLRNTTGGSSTFAGGSNRPIGTEVSTSSVGGGLPHNNLHPVVGVNRIIYAK